MNLDSDCFNHLTVHKLYTFREDDTRDKLGFNHLTVHKLYRNRGGQRVSMLGFNHLTVHKLYIAYPRCQIENFMFQSPNGA